MSSSANKKQPRKLPTKQTGTTNGHEIAMTHMLGAENKQAQAKQHREPLLSGLPERRAAYRAAYYKKNKNMYDSNSSQVSTASSTHLATFDNVVEDLAVELQKVVRTLENTQGGYSTSTWLFWDRPRTEVVQAMVDGINIHIKDLARCTQDDYSAANLVKLEKLEEMIDGVTHILTQNKIYFLDRSRLVAPEKALKAAERRLKDVEGIIKFSSGLVLPSFNQVKQEVEQCRVACHAAEEAQFANLYKALASAKAIVCDHLATLQRPKFVPVTIPSAAAPHASSKMDNKHNTTQVQIAAPPKPFDILQEEMKYCHMLMQSSGKFFKAIYQPPQSNVDEKGQPVVSLRCRQRDMLFVIASFSLDVDKYVFDKLKSAAGMEQKRDTSMTKEASELVAAANRHYAAMAKHVDTTLDSLLVQPEELEAFEEAERYMMALVQDIKPPRTFQNVVKQAMSDKKCVVTVLGYLVDRQSYASRALPTPTMESPSSSPTNAGPSR